VRTCRSRTEFRRASLSLSKGTAASRTCPNSWWEPPHLCGGRSALALCERLSTLITRFSAGNVIGLTSPCLREPQKKTHPLPRPGGPEPNAELGTTRLDSLRKNSNFEGYGLQPVRTWLYTGLALAAEGTPFIALPTFPQAV
jgi:hypothetical protein